MFVGVTAEHEGFYGTVGGFAGDFSGNYGEVGYGFSAAELDFTISGIVNDSDLSGPPLNVATHPSSETDRAPA